MSDELIEGLLWPVLRSADNESLATYTLVLESQYTNSNVELNEYDNEVNPDYIEYCEVSQEAIQDLEDADAEYEEADTFYGYLLQESESACTSYQDTMTAATFMVVGAQSNLDEDTYAELELGFDDDAEGFCDEFSDCTVRDWAIESLKAELGLVDIADGLCNDPSFNIEQNNLRAQLELYGDKVIEFLEWPD